MNISNNDRAQILAQALPIYSKICGKNHCSKIWQQRYGLI